MRIAFYDTKPYDHDYFRRAEGADRLKWHFHDFSLSTETATPLRARRPSVSL